MSTRDDDSAEGPPTSSDTTVLSGATYRGLSEQVLSPAEERFERVRRTTGLFLAPLTTIVMLLVPLGMNPSQHRLAAVLLGVVVLWLCESVPIPVAGLLGVAAIVLLGVAPPDEVMAPFGSSTLFTFIGAFILSQAMLRHGLAHRFAFRILSLPGVGRTSTRVLVAFGAVTALLSAFVSSTATVAMLLPTALGLLSVISKLLPATSSDKKIDPLRLRLGTALMLMLSYSAVIGGLLTPIGTPPNLIGREYIEEATGRTITFLDWMLMAAPVVGVMFVVMCGVLLLLNRPEIKKLSGVESYVAAERTRLGGLSRAEKNTLIAFGLTVTLWILPSIVALIAGEDSAALDTVKQHLDEGIVAVLGASLLFVLPTNWPKREFTLTWSEAVKIDWGTILLFGSGMIFGTQLADTGLAQTVATSSAGALGLSSIVGLSLFAIVLAVTISETTSNTASAAVVVPIVLPLAAAADVNPMIPAMCATFAASFGFVLPVSTPPNAIVYGSGAVPITKMMRSGISLDFAGMALVALLLPVMIGLVLTGG
ncbi:sodium-dependent dicarboxylate transporter 2/3/5 [Saccharopolyspora lacisalsi]|uniref:Sodium-dependent dicarboxylate transporter SdcS n=1 Tax=Halosaccharopolyspora lacisalsi TaxID=1000566 RepID=A0A839DXK4_9PSEU|nr:DASS family sodium-coupled anion symporter [Halosaccharopolyspora lacisalsi]MBA8823951.1 sodium-dependent dicarboxylate transporter 2/3/5 [Halosaccharopolyspora lacisalsi]